MKKVILILAGGLILFVLIMLGLFRSNKLSIAPDGTIRTVIIDTVVNPRIHVTNDCKIFHEGKELNKNEFKEFVKKQVEEHWKNKADNPHMLIIMIDAEDNVPIIFIRKIEKIISDEGAHSGMDLLKTQD